MLRSTSKSWIPRASWGITPREMMGLPLRLSLYRLPQYAARRLVMLTKIQKWGNSQGVRVPLRLLEEVKIAVGDEVDVTVQEGRIVVSSSQRIRGKYRLEDLLAQ